MRNEQMKNAQENHGVSGRKQVQRATLWVALLLALVLSSCRAPAQQKEASAPPVQTAPTRTPVAVNSSDGPLAPDWSLETLDGGRFRLAETSSVQDRKSTRLNSSH